MDCNETPSPNGVNGSSGRFQAGNKFGRGNPYSRQVAALRRELLRVVTPDDVAEIVRALVDKAKAGDLHAAREILDRTIGKPASVVQVEIAERLELLESVLQRWSRK